MTQVQEQAFIFSCQHEQLIAILHPSVTDNSRRGVLLVVGGPQYRVGSHRQFVLLARDLAQAGFPTMRFDYRGMGDSTGANRDFSAVDDDIKAALDVFLERQPQLTEVIIWGLCDAASAALFYAYKDSRVSGLVLLNPWVRTETSLAKATLKNYYLQRFFNPNLWRKIASGQFDFSASIRSFLNLITKASKGLAVAKTTAARQEIARELPLPERMAIGWQRFGGQVLLILSGNDLTAAEFKMLCDNSTRWQQLLADTPLDRAELPTADHTFSRRDWRDQVATHTIRWLQSW